jgi:DNA gyrase subunit A
VADESDQNPQDPNDPQDHNDPNDSNESNQPNDNADNASNDGNGNDGDDNGLSVPAGYASFDNNFGNAENEQVMNSLAHGEHVWKTDLDHEMRESYLAYALSVIVERALPDVRDGLKPVHRRVIYAMYDGGYRPDRGYNKCSRVVGDVMGKYHPHGDAAIYDTLVRLAQPWSMRYPLVDGQGNFGSAGNDPPAAMRYTECRMAPLAMEMVRDIDKDTVDFVPNYDGKTQEPTVLPARFPNLLVNGSSGIAVGMATNIPPHNMREVADGVHWALDHPDASREELLDNLIRLIKGPDFPTGATILGHRGIEKAYRTGRGLITMRAVVNTEEIRGRMCLVITELPYQVNPDKLVTQIRDEVRQGVLTGIADMRDETSGRTGERLVLVLKKDAIPKIVLNNLYKHTQLQTTFGANMLALVDGTPRTLSLDGFISHWIDHQLDVVNRRTRYLKKEAQDRDHILQGYLKAIDMIDEVIHTIRASRTQDEARVAIMKLLDVDQVQADAILAMQLRRLAALERQKIVDEHNELIKAIADYNDILAHPERQRKIVGDELDGIVAKYGDDRRTRIVPYSGDLEDEDLIADRNVVITLTRSGYLKSTLADDYRAQHRGGKGIKGTRLRGGDVVDHFLTASTHDWLLFFTNKGRVYRIKAYEVPQGSRDSKGQHIANLLSLQPGEHVQCVLGIRSYEDAKYLVLATRSGRVKKTLLSEYDSPRQGGLIAIKLNGADSADADADTDTAADADENQNSTAADEVVGAALANDGDDVILVSRKGMSVRFNANESQLRSMGRGAAGVRGMKFRDGDELLSMDVIAHDSDKDLLLITSEGFGKRTPLSDYHVQGRNGFGVKAMALAEGRGSLVGSVVVTSEDQIMAIMRSGKVIRFAVDEVKETGRNTQGVTIAKPGRKDQIVEIAIAEPDDDEGERAKENAEIAQRAQSLVTQVSGVSAASTIMANPDEAGSGDASSDESSDDGDTGSESEE